MEDKGSHPRYAEVSAQGVLLQGVVDTGSDLTIMGREAFKKVATVAKLRKRDSHPADKKAYSYDGKPFTLDGRLQLDLTFGEYAMSTPVHVKMDADDQLLLPEGVCRQLGIVTYHPSVQEHKKPEATTLPQKDKGSQEAKVPAIRVKLLNSACLSPNHCTLSRCLSKVAVRETCLLTSEVNPHLSTLMRMGLPTYYCPMLPVLLNDWKRVPC